MLNGKSSQKDKNKKVYDLEDRTARFGESVICFVKGISDIVKNKNSI